VATKPKPAAYGERGVSPPTPAADWQRSNGTYIAGRAYLDQADLTAAQMDAKWGVDRLRLLVPPDLREKFDRQRYLLNRAINKGELEDVRREAQRMVNAWLTLDRAAFGANASLLSPNVWEVGLPDGSVAAIARNGAEAGAVAASGRKVAFYTLEEIARLLEAFPTLVKAKLEFPGCEVSAAKQTIGDPLDGIHDTTPELDDDLPF
jgi:hypothetical protein